LTDIENRDHTVGVRWMERKDREMFCRIFIVGFCCLFFSGCMYNDEPMPQLAQEYNTRVVAPQVLKPAKTQQKINASASSGWQPSPQVEKQWTAIVVHHSASSGGNASIFNEWHKNGKKWDGIGYDFVIGNGSQSGDGEVEVTFRWLEQKTGAHCGGTPGNWANIDAVGICLVGNFNQTSPTFRQMQSLSKLVKFLQSRYRISKSRVYGHGTTPGAHKTDCPGRNFSMSKLKSMLDF